MIAILGFAIIYLAVAVAVMYGLRRRAMSELDSERFDWERTQE